MSFQLSLIFRSWILVDTFHLFGYFEFAAPSPFPRGPYLPMAGGCGGSSPPRSSGRSSSRSASSSTDSSPSRAVSAKLAEEERGLHIGRLKGRLSSIGRLRKFDIDIAWKESLRSAIFHRCMQCPRVDQSSNTCTYRVAHLVGNNVTLT